MNYNNQDPVINGLIKGDQRVLKEFYEKLLPQVTSYIVKNSGTELEAEDIFQDAMVFVYEKIENNTLQLTSSLGTYVYAVSRNLWMNKLKRSNKVFNHEGIVAISIDNDAGIIEEISTKERKYLYQKYFLKLGKSCQEMLSLFFDGLSMKDIAEQKGFTEAYTRKRKFECKSKLVKMIQEDPSFDELAKNMK